jgi:hypothetical protein
MQSSANRSDLQSVLGSIRSVVYFRAYLGACNKVHLAACFPVCCIQCNVYSVQRDI